MDSWEKMLFTPTTCTWTQEKVMTGINWRSFQNLIKPNELQLRALEYSAPRQGIPVQVSDLFKVTNQDFNNYPRSHLKRVAQLYGNCRPTLNRYVQKVQERGGYACLET